MTRIVAASARQKELLLDVAVRWLGVIPDWRAEQFTEAELESMAVDFIGGADWHREVADTC